MFEQYHTPYVHVIPFIFVNTNVSMAPESSTTTHAGSATGRGEPEENETHEN